MKRLLFALRRWVKNACEDEPVQDESHARIRYGIPEAVKARQRAEWDKLEELSPLDEAGRP